MTASRRKTAIRFSIPLIMAIVLVAGIIGSGAAASVPTITIDSVVADTSVTISGTNFPAGQTFTVRMGPYGNKGLNGTEAGVLVTTTGDKFTATFTIPAALTGSRMIAIRLDSPEGYFSYNWFWNASSQVKAPAEESTATPAAPAYTGYPTFGITDVEKGVAVGVETLNMPAGKTFKVTMGAYGTKGVGGIEAGTLDSAAGGVLKATFSIPAELKDMVRIAIRMETEDGFFAYNWFWNNSTGSAAAGGDEEAPAYTGIPTIGIDAVVADTSVTLTGANFPAGETFTVLMGAYGSKGVGGIEVGSYDSGAGGAFTKTFSIPAELAGSYRIAIRLESEGGYYAYNWFFNNSTVE